MKPPVVITFDFETRSYADLKKVGAWAYSEDPTTDVVCACWGIGNDPIREWWPAKFPGGSDGMPEDLREAVINGAHVEAHNVAFERSIWANVMAPKYGWYLPYDDCWRDTMAVASYYSMPPALDKLARTLGFEGKHADGGRLITKYSKLHLKTAKLEIPPEDHRKFVDYCVQDVKIEQSVSDYLGDLPDREWPAFQLDQIVNLRGIYLDQEGIDAATAIVDQRAEDLTQEFRSLTSPTGDPAHGLNPTQRDKVMAWFAANELPLPDLKAETLEELLEDGEIPQGPWRRALEIRVAINKASTKKLDAMSRQRGRDGRARFQARYHGAGTGRDTGSGFQPLNLSRGFEDVEPDQLVRDIMHGDARWLDAVYGDAMDAVSKASRHWIMAQPGNKIMAGDFVSIEAVILACLAGEQWKIDAFSRGDPLYAVMACKIHNIPESVALELGDKKFKAKYNAERQDGKVGELAFGYQGALGAWLNFDKSGRHTDERIVEICKAWRAAHPMIVQLWRELEDASIEAVRFPGRETGYRQIGFEVVDDWLSMILPDGKRIWYFKPEIRATMPQWHKPLTDEECAAGTCDCRPRPQLTYMAQKFGQWKRVSTYGGKLAENATQATSRQVLVPALLRLEDANYSLILKVYDEAVVEVPADFGSEKEFAEILKQSPGEWADGWPINVDVWTGERYKK